MGEEQTRWLFAWMEELFDDLGRDLENDYVQMQDYIDNFGILHDEISDWLERTNDE